MSSPSKDHSIDLMNVEYDDVLHLYRGWRRAENILKDKNKEIIKLQEKIVQYEQSTSKFHVQIESLEAVKELTIDLQNQLTILNQQNNKLVTENLELAELNIQAEEFLKEKVDKEDKNVEMLRKTQMDLATLRGRYEEIIIAKRDLELILADEQLARLSIEKRLKSTEDTLPIIRSENIQLKSKLVLSNSKLKQSLNELDHVSEHLSILSDEIQNIKKKDTKISNAVRENEILKGDICRLIKILENYPPAAKFIKRWHESDELHYADQNIDNSYNYDIDDKYNDNNIFRDVHITSSELSNLKEIYLNDNNEKTLSTTFNEESELWIPREAVKMGLLFLQSNAPSASSSILLTLLKDINKIWLLREKKKIKVIKQYYSKLNKDLNRKLSNKVPYKGVIFQQEIRRLSNDLKNKYNNHLKGHPKRAKIGDLTNEIDIQEEFEILNTDNFNENFNNYQNTKKSSSPSSSNKKSKKKRNNKESLSPNKFFDSSSNSIDISSFSKDTNHSMNEPTEEFLKGAIFMGKKIDLLVGNLCSNIHSVCTKQLSEVVSATEDVDIKRSLQRLSFLSSSGSNESLSLSHHTHSKIKKMIENISLLDIGDEIGFKNFQIDINLNNLNKSLITTPLAPKIKSSSIYDDNDIMTPYSNTNVLTPKSDQSSGQKSVSFLTNSIYDDLYND